MAETCFNTCISPVNLCYEHRSVFQWVEIGNSGMFRPEMLLPMGLPADVNVAGYGLSLERYGGRNNDIRKRSKTI